MRMNKLQIVRVANDVIQKANLEVGNNIISCDSSTGTSNEKIVQNAVTINLSPSGDMTLTPCQVLPCYIKPTGSSRWQLLKFDTTVPVKPGDICYSLSNKCLFKIMKMCDTMKKDDHLLKRKCTEELAFEPPDKKTCLDTTPKLIMSHGDCSNKSQDNRDSKIMTICDTMEKDDHLLKRKCTEELAFEPPDKKTCLDIIPKLIALHGDCSNKFQDNRDSKPMIAEKTISSNGDSIDASTFSMNMNASLPEINQTIPSPMSVIEGPNLLEGPTFVGQQNPSIKQEKAEDVKVNIIQEPVVHASDNDELHTLTQDVLQSSVTTQNEAGASSTIQAENIRNKCIYADKCYRKNPCHKVKFSHPGDPDFDVIDERPECPYGVHCYRKNFQHKATFKHSTVRRCRAPTPVRTTYIDDEYFDEPLSDEESVDESDYEPSDYTSEENRTGTSSGDWDDWGEWDDWDEWDDSDE